MNSPQQKPLFQQVTCLKHTYGPRIRKAPHETESGHEQHEWKCQLCPLVKITVMPKGRAAIRMYRSGEAGNQFESDFEPACSAGEVKGMKA